MTYSGGTWIPVDSNVCALHANGQVNVVCPLGTGIVAGGYFANGLQNFAPPYVAYYGPVITQALYSRMIVSNTNCNGNNGQITTDVQGGVPPYTYLWSTGATTPTIRSLSPGTYYLTVTDAQGDMSFGYKQIDSGCFSYITGTVFIDANSDCVFDSTDVPLSNYDVELLSPSGQHLYGSVDSNGRYFIGVSETGNYTYLNNFPGGSCLHIESCSGQYDTVHVNALGDTVTGGNLGFT
jgi:hypothetical protein